MFAAAPSPARAADRYWQGTSSNIWTNTFNWLGFTPPGSADNATFDIAGGLPPVRSDVVLDASRTVANMYVRGDSPVGAYSFSKTGGALLTVSGTTDVGTVSGSTATTTLNGFLLNTGSLNFYGPTTANLSASTAVTASGSVQLNQSSILNLIGGSTVNSAAVALFNQSQMTISGSSTFTTTNGAVESQLQNSAKLTIGNGIFNAAGNVSVLGGELVLDAGSTFNLSGGRTLTASGSASKITINRGFGVNSNTSLTATVGGDIVASSYVDVGNGNTGFLGLDGVGTTLSTAGATASDWGANAAGSFTGQLTNSAVATLQQLRMGTNNAAASLSVLSNSTLTTAAFTMGGGSTVRNVSLTINGGTFSVSGNAIFNDKAVVNLTSGSLQFLADATFNTGATLSRTSGAFNSTGVFLNFAGGTYNRNAVGSELGNASALRLTAGGQSPGANYFDLANANTTGTLLVDGTGSLFTTGGGTVSDWGRNLGHSATVTLSNSGQANVSSLQIGTNNAAANVSVASGALLSTTGTLLVGGGTTARTVSLDVTGGTLITGGVATLDNKALLTLGTAGTVNFNNGATVLTGGTLSQTGGTLGIAPGKTLSVAGGVFNRNATSGELSNGATLSLTAGGQSTGTGYFDIARLNTAGTLTVDGAGTLYTAGNLSDWGAGTGRTANVAISNSAQANLTSTANSLQIGTNNAAASVSVTGLATLGTAGTLFVGGGAAARTVALNIAGGTLTTAGLTTLDNTAVLNLGAAAAGGTINFNNGATLLTGSTLNWSSGTLAIAAGKTLSVNGGTLTRTTGGGELDPNTTLAVTNGGTVTTASKFDITTGTLNVANAGSSLTVSNASDWAKSAGQTATVNVTDSGVITSNSFVNLGFSGGTTNLTINTGGRLNINSLYADYGGTSNIGVNSPSAAPAAITTTTETYLGSSATLTLTSGRVSLAQLHLVDSGKIVPAATTNTGTVAATSLVMSGTSKIDLASGKLELNYTGVSPLATLRDYIGTGFNGGNWLGNRITSSAAAISMFTALYYGGTSTQINVKLALYGDADGDGGVSINDFNALAGNFGVASGKFWTDGDFDYDGGVSINDFNRLASNFGKTLAAPSEGPNYTALALWGFAVAHHDEAAFIAATGVPEPTALGLFAVGGLAGLRRRQR